MNENIIFATVFVAVLILVFALLSIVARNREINRNIIDVTTDQDIASDDDAFNSENDAIRHYFEVLRKNRPDSLEMRLISAGFFNRNALRRYNIIRLVITGLVFLLVQVAGTRFFVETSPYAMLVFSGVIAGLVFILTNAVLDYFIRKVEVSNRKLFPDFMDLLVVCVDAGLSIEAAIDRVARDFLLTKPVFGRHLSIIGLEVRAGRPLHEALMNFSDRVRLEEARTLATLFRQSQELGASVVKTLRSYSNEMRQLRLIRAEEKANALPVKMLFPLAVFLFPVNLVIVIVPIMITILRMFETMKPGG
jgi:tight adherence protein C